MKKQTLSELVIFLGSALNERINSLPWGPGWGGVGEVGGGVGDGGVFLASTFQSALEFCVPGFFVTVAPCVGLTAAISGCLFRQNTILPRHGPLTVQLLAPRHGRPFF
jgi:hypothetical protein